MKKISCNVIQDLIPLYIERICSEESNELISDHIQECKECRMSLEEAEKSLFEKMEFPQKENIEKEEFEIFKKIIKKYQKQAMKKIIASAIGIFIVFFGARWYWCTPHISILYEEAIYDTFLKTGEQSGDEFFWWEGYTEKMTQTWEGGTLVLEGKTSHAYRMEQEKESVLHTGWIRLTDSLERIVYRDVNGDHVIWEK